jgi:hypothetical protein
MHDHRSSAADPAAAGVGLYSGVMRSGTAEGQPGRAKSLSGNRGARAAGMLAAPRRQEISPAQGGRYANVHREFPTGGYPMGNRSVSLLTFLALLLPIDSIATAQTPAPNPAPPTALSKRALRQQDRDECNKQAAQQNIAKQNLANFSRKCMAERQAARKSPGR